MEPSEIQSRSCPNPLKHYVQTLLIDTERRWFPSHAHRATLGLPTGIDTHSNARSYTQALADSLNALNFPKRFHMDFTNGMGEHQFEFSVGLARPCKQHPLWWASSLEGLMELSSRGNFKTASLLQEVLQDGATWIGFYGVAETELRRECLPQEGPFMLQHMSVIDEQGCTIGGRNGGHRNP